ncbi:phosphoketolase family protein [Demequina sp. B12]|uniref:phosphoketolase family protein n=1 Tax=Demequina sp. B12 TaxID=2992757 RepID=UPI00237C2B43|nr:phosphoketolase family protein [Demequina sp. B12]MDE0572492.1 phosphoketolase family protein [Demequina sp. B12]
MMDNTPWAPRTAPAASAEEIDAIDRWWRATNYMSVGQIYLLANPLLREPLHRDHVKPRLVGHWGTTPGLNFVYAHLNRMIRARQQPTMYIIGPGHGGPGLVASSFLDGTYTETYPDLSPDEAGLTRLFKQFSFPGGIPSHVAPETPGSIHEGGELGYALSHAYGAAFNNPHLLVAAIVGDGEAETGPLATSWHSNKFVDPTTDGVVLPILHLNGYKIANPTVLARISDDELDALMRGYGHTPYFFEAGFDDEDAFDIHQRFSQLLDEVMDHIATIKAEAATNPHMDRPAWPMIVLRTPKGWTCPPQIDGETTEGSWRAHQVPLSNARDTDAHLHTLESWLESYRPDELFDASGAPYEQTRAIAPEGDLRMSARPEANGGLVLRDLRLPDYRDYAVDVPQPGAGPVEATRVLGTYLRGVMEANMDNFRVFAPDELASNRIHAVLDVTDKVWQGAREDDGAHTGPRGQVVEMLSEHQCQGWLEGYLLTGRHGLFTSYEAFIHIVDSMFNQHAKWLKVSRELPWRRPIASLNYLLSSHVWRQDHNGFSHQDPGFIDHVVNKKAEVVRVYLPADANTLLSTYDHCLRSRDYVNVVIAGKQPAPQWLTMEQAIDHCTRGLGIWDFASNVPLGDEPDVVMAAAGDVPTLEVLAAIDIIRRELPELKVRMINVVDLMRLQPEEEHPHGISDRAFDQLFTTDKPIIFNYHGYPWLIHRLTYRRNGHSNLHVRGFKEEGTTTTPFDMAMLNDIDRYHLVMDVIDRVPGLGTRAALLRQQLHDQRLAARRYARENGADLPEVANWVWPDAGAETREAMAGVQDTGGDNE